MGLESSVGQDPAVDPRMERLDPAVQHLGEPGDGRHVGHGQSGVAQRLRGAPGGHEFEAGLHEAARERHEARLVGNGQQGPPRSRDGTVRLCDVQIDPPSIGGDAQDAGQQGRHRARVEAMFDRLDPGVEHRDIVAGQDLDCLLGDDRAAVQRRIDEMDRATGHLRAVGDGVGDGVAAGERREQ